MCGIVAVIGRNDAAHQVEAGLDDIRYRGIRRGIDYGRGWALGHTRLPIIGVGEEFDQPMQRGRWRIAYVGEIFNYKSMSDLPCDSPFVADRWVNRGPISFTELDGFWSVVAYDMVDETLHCLVDYLSQKPLYVRWGDGWMAVASELRPLVGTSEARPSLDQTYLSAVRKWGYCPDLRRTPYEGVTRLTPGEYVRMDRYGIEQTIHVDTLEPATGSVDSIKGRIIEAINLRSTVSDVPVACLVSGGLDSSIVYTIGSRYANLKPYHVDNGEIEYAKMVCPEIKVSSIPRVSIEECLADMQEPIDLGSLIPQSNLASSIFHGGRERVCLTGDGADELFGGYTRASEYDSQYSDVFQELPAWHLPRLDRIMMKRQIEVRSPFLSRGVVEYALGLDRNMRIGKRVLKDLFRSDLSVEIVDREKKALRSDQYNHGRIEWSRKLVDMFIEEYERCRG